MEKIGSIEAYRIIRLHGFNASLNLLYALEGAIRDLHWTALTGWRPGEFGYSVFGSEMKLRFPVVKLPDFSKDERRLRRRDNPFAVVTLAHLKALETRRSPSARMKAKLGLIRLLRERKEMRRDVIDLLRFIDWEPPLPQNMELKLRETIEEEDKEMGKPANRSTRSSNICPPLSEDEQ